ncbi:hypothetical protein C8F04DRAFT_1193769 [Mycena alexandri]|uniref:Uncharacterized protein n=1 Tax=Mycena alexandri TaxID=1745969 RepID=A0AAD6WVW4_9AGAR|nr:hypothetical protein C8F04DRAFT_1193769 [Mycena alexandri]
MTTPPRSQEGDRSGSGSPNTPSRASRGPTLTYGGGQGGLGGPSKNQGGEGGLGRAAILPVGDVELLWKLSPFANITAEGGNGGGGGNGTKTGGRGGVGGAHRPPQPLLPGVDMKKLPKLALKDFCEMYSLSDSIRNDLEAGGWLWASTLAGVDKNTLEENHFKAGTIDELQRALQEFVDSELKKA